MKHIIDIIGDVVDSCRETGNVISITDNSNDTYTITTTDIQNLTVNSYVSFLNTSNFTKSFYVISSILNNTFTISETSGITITTLGTWKSLSPYFYFEKWLGAANEVSLNHNVFNYTKQNYPLVFLLLDITEKRDQLPGNQFSEFNAKIFFINYTKPDVDANYRLTNNFKTVLIPLYEKFLTELKNNFYIITENNLIEHDYTERYYLGTANQNQNALNDTVDAIETNFSLTIKRISECLT